MKKNKTILIVSLSVIGAIVIGIGGFAMERKIIESVSDAIDLSYESRDKRIEKECRKHLKEKYGDFDYQVSGVSPRDGVLQKYDIMNAYVLDREGAKRKFTVTGAGTIGTNNYEMSDNYYPIMVSAEYEDMIKSIAEKYFSECKVYFDANNNYLPNNITKDTPLKEILDKNLLTTMIRIAVDKDTTDFEKRSHEFIEDWKNTGWNASIYVYQITGYDFNTFTRETLNNMEYAKGYKEIHEDIDCFPKEEVQ